MMLNSRPDGRRNAALRTVMIAGVVAGLVFGPLCLGSTLPLPRFALQIVMALIGVCWLLSDERHSGLLLVPILAILPALLQLIPMPRFLLFTISPLARHAEELLLDIGIGSRFPCISMDPGATAAAAAQLFLVMTVIVAVAATAAGRIQRRRIAWALGIMGIVVLALGIIFSHAPMYRVLGLYDMTGPIRPWKNPLLPRAAGAGTGDPDVVSVAGISYVADAPTVGNVCGPYASSNSFAGFVEMTLPVALAVTLGAAGPARRRRWAFGLAALVLGLTGLLTVAFIAKSRAGTASLICGGVIGFAALLRSGRARFALRSLAIAGFIGLLLFTIANPTRDSSIGHRLDAWRAALHMTGGSPALGIGLGAFGALEPWFHPDPLVLYYAHNDYVQFLAEAGAVGLAALACALWFLLRKPRMPGNRHVPVAMESSEPPSAGAADRVLHAGLLAAVAAMALHSFFDYNLHVPANAFIFAVVFGLFLGSRRATEPAGANRPDSPCESRSALPSILLIVVAVCGLGALKDLFVESRVAPLRRALLRWRLSEPFSRGFLESDLHEQVAAAESVAALAPWDAEARDLLAQGRLQLAEGRKTDDLIRARRWFADKLRLCPLDDGDVETVRRIDAALRGPTPSP
jgi:hypothetical protein